MSAVRPAEILRQLEHTGAPDVELLAQFVLTNSAVAFEELVRRHGALVLGVCRRVTRNPQDAEDAFQATFLVLAQKAGALRSDVRLWSWLYGVAFRVSWRARRASFRRRAREVLVSKLPEPCAPVSSPEEPELGSILDEELAALSEWYREAIILCDLRGASREEAATALGVPEGTLSSRLANGRKKLAARLAKRGIALSVSALPIAVAETQGATTVPIELIRKTCGLVTDFASGGTSPGPLIELTKRGLVVRKTLVFGLVVVAAITGAVIAANPVTAPPADPPKPPAVAKTEVVTLPQGEQKDLPALATVPRIIAGWDLPIANPERVIWAPSGDRLAVVGAIATRAREEGELRFQPAFVLLKYTEKSDPEHIVRTEMPRNGSVVGFTRDGKQLITDRRERHLLSGLHQLVYWDPEKAEADPRRGAPRLGEKAKLRTVNFNGGDMYGYVFSSSDKTFRAGQCLRNSGTAQTINVIEVDTASGKLGKPLATISSGQYLLSPDGKRLVFTDPTGSSVRVHDFENRDKTALREFKWSETVDAKNCTKLRLSIFSPDSKRLAVFGDDPVGGNPSRGTIVDVSTSKLVAVLEGEPTFVHNRITTFSSDGRLFAATEQSALTVWDASTGRTLKSWKIEKAVPAFHPTRPLLVVAEPNGEGETRLGFWDFSAEVEKK